MGHGDHMMQDHTAFGPRKPNSSGAHLDEDILVQAFAVWAVRPDGRRSYFEPYKHMQGQRQLVK